MYHKLPAALMVKTHTTAMMRVYAGDTIVRSASAKCRMETTSLELEAFYYMCVKHFCGLVCQSVAWCPCTVWH